MSTKVKDIALLIALISFVLAGWHELARLWRAEQDGDEETRSKFTEEVTHG